MVYWITGAVLLIYLLLVWFFAGWINPPGSGIWVLRVGLWLIGIISAAFTVWWFRRQANVAEQEASGLPAGATTEVDLLVHEAVRKLKKSAMGRGSSLRNLPLIFLVGDPASAKTTTIIHSALDPELLAGHVYQDNTVVPTRVANFWYTRQAVFVDGGGGLFAKPELWRRLIRLVQPGRVAAARKQQQAPRAAIVCLDCELLRSGSQEAILSAARRLGTRLLEISQTLGISFPIYVLFTKADRIGARTDGGSAFFDYVAGLRKDEISQVLGATLPVRSLQASGVYADEETRRLEKAFDEIFYSLAEKRIDFLSVAGQADKLAGIYEFPRELRKLRQHAVPFLVELARPSQLSVNPFLRGFYFAGIRPVIIEGASAPMPEPVAADAGFNANATVIFGGGGMRAPQPALAPRASSRKVPEWVFLSQLFNEVILKDRVALSASGFSSRVSLLRRFALAAVIGIALVFAAGFITSFLENFFLQRDVKQAVEGVQKIQATGQTPTLDQLTALDALRQQLVPLSGYYNHTRTIPWKLRWWLYSGDDFYPASRQAYFQGFSNLLFADAEKKLLTTLQNGKEKPGPTDAGDQYQVTYSDLRAYLITTRPEDAKYSTRDFLTPVLVKHWREVRSADEATFKLATEQFDFYSTELPINNPFSLTPDVNAIARAQDYLAGFTGIERYYFPLLEKARTSTNHDTSFRTQFPGDSGIIDSRDTVRAAFTREGFPLVQTAINAPTNQMSEEWVLGRRPSAELEPTALRQELKNRYRGDYIQTWLHVLSNARVVISGSNPQANASTLEVLAGPESPILHFIWFVSYNTSVDDPDISAVFASVQGIVPPGPDKSTPTQYKLPSNQPYTDALGKLREDMSTLAKSTAPPGDTHLSDQANQSAEAVRSAADKVAGTQVNQYHVTEIVARLLKEPATDAQTAIGGAGKAGLNAAGQQFCQELGRMKTYFPFNRAGQDLPVEQLTAVLGPGPASALQTLSSKISPFIVRQGLTYTPNDSGAIKLSHDFINFFNRVKRLSEALYPNGLPAPRVDYTLKETSANFDGLALKIGNETLSAPGQQRPFTWTGLSEDIVATQKDVPIENVPSGPWAIFHFMSDGHAVSRTGAMYTLDFIRGGSNNADLSVGGKRFSYSYELHFLTGDPWAEFSGLNCVSQVAR